jgi:hypothetical protein
MSNVVNMPTTSSLDQIRSAVGAYHIGNFGGKERFIRFDLNAFAEMENKFGNMEAAQERLKAGSMKDIRTVLWLGLIWDEVVLDDLTGEPIRYTLSEYQVGSWLTTLNLEAVMSKLQDAISGSLPDNPENKPSGEVMTNAVQPTQEGTLPN